MRSTLRKMFVNADDDATPPGDMKKVLQSFLSRVTSLISFVMLTSLPATGGTRRKSRILRAHRASQMLIFWFQSKGMCEFNFKIRYVPADIKAVTKSKKAKIKCPFYLKKTTFSPYETLNP